MSDARLETTPIELRVSEHAGWTVISVAGEVDVMTSPAVKEQVQAVTAEGAQIILDLTATTFFDSSGLSAVVSAYKILRLQSGELRIVTDSRRVVKVFEIAGLDRIVPIHPTVADAVAA